MQNDQIRGMHIKKKKKTKQTPNILMIRRCREFSILHNYVEIVLYDLVVSWSIYCNHREHNYTQKIKEKKPTWQLTIHIDRQYQTLSFTVCFCVFVYSTLDRGIGWWLISHKTYLTLVPIFFKFFNPFIFWILCDVHFHWISTHFVYGQLKFSSLIKILTFCCYYRNLQYIMFGISLYHINANIIYKFFQIVCLKQQQQKRNS